MLHMLLARAAREAERVQAAPHASAPCMHLPACLRCGAPCMRAACAAACAVVDSAACVHSLPGLHNAFWLVTAGVPSPSGHRDMLQRGGGSPCFRTQAEVTPGHGVAQDGCMHVEDALVQFATLAHEAMVSHTDQGVCLAALHAFRVRCCAACLHEQTVMWLHKRAHMHGCALCCGYPRDCWGCPCTVLCAQQQPAAHALCSMLCNNMLHRGIKGTVDGTKLRAPSSLPHFTIPWHGIVGCSMCATQA
jgi:hypothetical protein